MSTYCFLTSEFMPSADASGICVYNLSKELIKNDHKVIVICEGQNGEHRFYEGIEVYEVKPSILKYWRTRSIRSKKKLDFFITECIKHLRRLVRIITLFSFPDVSPLRTKKEYKLLTKIHKQHSLDYVIGAFRPYEGIGAINRFKRKKTKVCSIALYWDLIRGKNPFGQRLYKLFDYLCYKSEKLTFSLNDKILIPQSGKITYDTDRFSFVKEKIEYFDFPVFTQNHTSSSNIISGTNDEINLMCIGTIDGKNRSAQYFLQLVKELNLKVKQNIQVHIVGEFNDIKTYEEFKNESFVNFHGVVDYKDIPGFIEKADFLINIANKETYDMIPSKIFQYFVSCKPIINFVAHEKDKSLEYFNKYPLKCNIFEYKNNIDEDAISLENYLFNTKFITLNYLQVEALYQSSTPEYFIKKFLI